jgi:hypothetical protein
MVAPAWPLTRRLAIQALTSSLVAWLTVANVEKGRKPERSR